MPQDPLSRAAKRRTRVCMDHIVTHYRTCSLCEATCGLEIRTRASEIVSIRGDEADPFSRGYLCPKGPALKHLHEDPDRLPQPMTRPATQSEPATCTAPLPHTHPRP